jgi:hypothetical protein
LKNSIAIKEYILSKECPTILCNMFNTLSKEPTILCNMFNTLSKEHRIHSRAFIEDKTLSKHCRISFRIFSDFLRPEPERLKTEAFRDLGPGVYGKMLFHSFGVLR